MIHSNDPLKNYTKEDLKSLYEFLKDTTNSLKYELRGSTIDETNTLEFLKALKNCCYNTHQLSTYPFNTIPNYSVFSEPLDEMPLMINNRDYLTELIAKWRLIIGK